MRRIPCLPVFQPLTESNDTGESQSPLRVIQTSLALGSPLADRAESPEPNTPEVVEETEEELEVLLQTGEVWTDVVEEFRDWHHRVSVFIRGLSRQLCQSAIEGCSEPEDLTLLREMSRLKEDLEWHLQQLTPRLKEYRPVNA